MPDDHRPDGDPASDRGALDELRAALGASARGGVPREPRPPDCLDDATLAALVDGSLDETARGRAVSHAAGCGTCRVALASVARAVESPAVAHELKRLRQTPRVRPLALVVPVAAAAVLLLFALPNGTNEVLSPHRAAPITAAPAPTAVWPVGRVSTAPSLLWNAVQGADRYRVTLFDAEATVLFATELRDTSTAVPDSVRLSAGGAYWWRVEARTGFDRWVPSELYEFSIGSVAFPR